jgi:hypothetical protein
MKKTTTTSLNRVLDSSPLAYAFTIEALLRVSDEVAASKPEDYPERSLIASEAWIEATQKIKHILTN